MARASGLRLQIDGLDEMLAGIKNADLLMADVMREILRGPLGREMAADLRARVSDHSRTGWTAAQIGVDDDGADGVQVGITRAKGDQKHPASPRANARSVGVWLESGAQAHLIPTRVTRRSRVAFRGRVVSRVAHPGMRGAKPMETTLRVYRTDGEELAMRELERRLGPKIGAT